jgi:hypothetical protein
MSSSVEDPVARAMIEAHIKHCDDQRAEVRSGIDTINENCARIWKEISRGRTIRFKVLVGVMMLSFTIIISLVGFIFNSMQIG